MKKFSKKPSIREDGFILNLTVWISLLLLMSTLLTSTITRTNSSTLKNNSDLLRSQEIAMGGFHIATALMGDEEFLASTLQKSKVTNLKISNADIAIRFEDEQGKIDLNTFPVEIIQEMLVAIGAKHGVDAFNAVEIANRLSNISTTENSEKGEKIRSISDLQFFDGVTLDFYKAIEPYITVHGLNRKVNPLTAPYEVLQYIPDVRKADLDKLFSARSSGKPRPILENAEVWLTELSGPIYKIIVTAELPNKISHTLTALVFLSENELGITADAVKIIELH